MATILGDLSGPLFVVLRWVDEWLVAGAIENARRAADESLRQRRAYDGLRNATPMRPEADVASGMR